MHHRTTRAVGALLTGTALVATTLSWPTAVVAAGTTEIVVDPSRSGAAIEGLSETLTSWFYQDDWLDEAVTEPVGYFAEEYPSVSTVDLFSATGGGYVAQSESISYYVTGMTGAGVSALFATGVEPANHLKFWVATTDPEVYTQVTSYSYTDTNIGSGAGAWTKREYSLGSMPSGATIFRISLPTGGANTYNPQISSVSVIGSSSFTDHLNDWSLMAGHSADLEFDTSNSGFLGDASRVRRSSNDRFTPSEAITYRIVDASTVSARVLYSTGIEHIDDVTFFVSTDKENWTQRVNWSATDTSIMSGDWTRRQYLLTGFPSGTAYLRINFPTGGANSWNPQLAEVAVTGPNAYTDSLNDLEVAEYVTSGLEIDSSNAALLGDSHRVRRTNAFEGFPGAVADRDLFVNPQDRNTLDDYDFDPLLEALRNIVAHGLTPKIRLSSVPIKFSEDPELGPFRTNIRPPTDYDAYSDYIEAIADAAVDEFGLAEVAGWSWGTVPEIENAAWFETIDGNPTSTRDEFFRLYDYTVAALETSLGVDNVHVGAHLMNQSPGLWDELGFIEHVATGTNAATGLVGTQLDYIDISYYEAKPGTTGQLETTPSGALSLAASVERVRSMALSVGLDDIRIGVAEGGILYDPDDRYVINNNMGDSYQASFDAFLLKRMNDVGLSDFSRWALNTEKIWGGVPGVSAHIDQFGQLMRDGLRVDVGTSGTPVDNSSVVDAIASRHDDDNVIRVLAFNHNPEFDGGSDEDYSVRITNVAPVSGSTVTVKAWRVDDDHANFWPTWMDDRELYGISDTTVGNYSPLGLTVPGILTRDVDRSTWYARETAYSSLAELTATTTTVTPAGGEITLSGTLPGHGVVFYEISNVEVAPSPVASTPTKVDELDNWFVANSHTVGLGFDTSNAPALGDSSRAFRTTALGTQSVDYWKLAASNASVVGLFATDAEPVIADFHFWASSDGITWTSVTTSATNDLLINSGNWTRREYTLNSLPAGTNYLRVEFPDVGVNTWNPQLSQVSIE